MNSCGYSLNVDDQVKKDDMGRVCSTNGAKRNTYRILVVTPEGMRPLGRPRLRWVDNIKMDLRELGWDGMDWIELGEDWEQKRALVNTAMNLLVPQNAGKFFNSCTIGCFSRRDQLHEVSLVVY
jgi:hypothetical protein